MFVTRMKQAFHFHKLTVSHHSDHHNRNNHMEQEELQHHLLAPVETLKKKKQLKLVFKFQSSAHSFANGSTFGLPRAENVNV